MRNASPRNEYEANRELSTFRVIPNWQQPAKVRTMPASPSFWVKLAQRLKG